VLIPLLDILQSVPVLGFFPVVLAIVVQAFNGSTFGLEIASMVLLFTSMEWSIVFGVIAGVKALPAHIKDMSTVFQISGWSYAKDILLPAIYPSVIAGSMLAWGSGWYFVIATEFISFGNKTYALPGLGYYLNRASFQYGSVWMSLAGLITIGAIVFTMNRLVWRRLDRKAKEYRFLALHGYSPKESRAERFWSRQVRLVTRGLDLLQRVRIPVWPLLFARVRRRWYFVAILIVAALVLAVFYGLISVPVSAIEAEHVAVDAGFSLLRLAIAYSVALVIAVSMGYLMLQRPKTRNLIMTIADVMQSIPALAYFPLLYLIFTTILPERAGLEISSVLLMLSGMLWYLVFNVIEMVEHWPAEINELSGVFGVKGWRYLRHMAIPALFPALIAGSILAWGGGWNATIVSEYIDIGGKVHSVPGLGSALDTAAGAGNTHELLVLLAVMVAIVITLNQFVWRPLLARSHTYVVEE